MHKRASDEIGIFLVRRKHIKERITRVWNKAINNESYLISRRHVFLARHCVPRYRKLVTCSHVKELIYTSSLHTARHNPQPLEHPMTNVIQVNLFRCVTATIYTRA